MIKENQQLFNRLNMLADGVIFYISFPAAFMIRFYVLPGGKINVPLERYLEVALLLTAVQMFTFSAFGLYQSFRRTPLRMELPKLWKAMLLGMAMTFGYLFITHEAYFSRTALAIAFMLSLLALSTKRIVLRRVLRNWRKQGYNLKHVVILGHGALSEKYLREISKDPSLGYVPAGYVSDKDAGISLPFLGNFDSLENILTQCRPDEVVSALEMEDFYLTPKIISVCEKTGVRLSIIPFYAGYMPSNPQADELNGIPMLNIRRIPLDNWANAFCKRALDIICSAALLLLTSPIMLICAIGVKLSSPGPVIFKQERIGRDKKPFYMYKFRSMKVNDSQDTAWSKNSDSRKTKFGSFLRKCSLDEFPQFWNVLKGDMSLVGPRPELPHFVEQFKEEIPLYMVKHQVRPGITGWAQVNGLRGDTSIKKRIEHDVYYIEHWSLQFDIQILLITVFGRKFMNDEKLN